VNSFRCGFSFHRNKVDLEHCKFVLGPLPSLRSNENRKAVQFCLALKTRSDVYRIAKNRIVEAKVGSEVADQASASIDAYANSKRQERLTGGIGFLLTLPIEHR